jgi:hypothetical protein
MYTKQTSPLKAIRAKCLDCSGDRPKEVTLCPVTDCELYPFRFGKNPNREGIGRFKSAALKTQVEPGVDPSTHAEITEKPPAERPAFIKETVLEEEVVS